MKSLKRSPWWLFLMAAVAVSSSAVDAWANNGLPDFTGLVKELSPAVVNISTTQKVQKGEASGLEIPDLPEGHPLEDLLRRFLGEGEESQEYETESLGSGFIISADGYVLSNYHVVEDAQEILVKLSDRRVIEGEVVGIDPRSDLALLKIDAEDLPTLEFGSSRALEVGEWVLAIGSPFGFEQSVTAGIVSAKGRSLPRENYVPFIQTDVAINPGNSGGPLFNMDGKIVGINSQIYSRTGGYMGLSFAIPIEVAMDVVEQLKATGKVTRGWLGVLIQEVTRELAESFDMDKPQGALVAKIFPDSPATKAGVQVGDVIIEFNGQPVLTSASLPPIVGRTGIGKSVPVQVLRGGDLIEVQVTIGELPEDAQIASAGGAIAASKIGLSVEAVSRENREALEIEKGGVQVKSVAPTSAGAEAGVREGDVIVMFDGQKVTDPDAFRDQVQKLDAGKSVPLLVQRSSGPVFLAIKIPDRD